MRYFPTAFPIPALLATLLLGSTIVRDAQGQAGETPEPFRTFMVEAQKRVPAFPQVPVGTEMGRHELFSVRLDEKPVVVDGHRFGCIRFVAPKEANLDMVWAFSVPAGWSQWYIFPATGSMDGFKNWFDADRLYEGLPATLDVPARLQSLAASSFTPGATYILWFKEVQPTTEPVHVTGAINFLKPAEADEEWKPDSMEKALGLKSASVTQQADYLKSRGARLLLDARYFTPDYAESRIDHLLFVRRQAYSDSSGFSIEMQISTPPCKTVPALADVQAAHGPADLVLTPAERKLFDEDASPDETAHFYDHVILLVGLKKGKPHVLSVTTQARDMSGIAPRQDGLTWGDADAPGMNLRVFYRDRKEIARIAFWGEAKARLLSGELPQETFVLSSRDGSGREELKHLGDGTWEYRKLHPGGELDISVGLTRHAFHGPFRAFYPDGRRKVEAAYLEGELDGEVTQWLEDGMKRTFHYEKGTRKKVN